MNSNSSTPQKSDSVTPTEAVNGLQADSQQSLTKPVDTAIYVTPTMTFGEVGSVADQETGGYAAEAHGVGEFSETPLLERMVLVDTIQWDASSVNPLYAADIDKFLRTYARNAQTLALFRMYRTDIEVTIKLNTNQFFYGSLMVTMFPGNATGFTVDARAILDPTVISASSAESVVKTWTWTWPYPWRGLSGPDATDTCHPVHLYIDIFNALKSAKSGMNTAVTVQIWARFKNIRLAYPLGPQEPVEAQSGRPKAAFHLPKRAAHPAQDPESGVSPITKLVDTVVSTPATLIDGAVGAIGSLVDDGIGSLLGGLFDKPDQVSEQTPMIIEGSKDLYAADVPDTNVCWSLNKARYVDPSPRRMPLSKDWTLLDYAKIPGIRTQNSFDVDAETFEFSPIQALTFSDQLRTPLDYACMCAALKRGSIRMMLQFMTSSFISARFVVQLKRDETGLTWDSNYDYGISKVINVKGDTVDYMTLPWLDYAWWAQTDKRVVRIKLDSTIACTDTAETPTIYLNVWIAAGDDFQFQYPRLPTEVEWPSNDSQMVRRAEARKKLSESRKSGKRPLRPKGIEPQAAIGKLFLQEFPPIVDNVVYDTDQGFCTGELIGSMTDVAKRYTCMNASTAIAGFVPTAFDATILDKHIPFAAGASFAQMVAQRRTFFGAMRECFLFRSGGYRYRMMPLNSGSYFWKGDDPATDDLVNGTYYNQPFDNIARITVPQVSTRPFTMFDDNTSTALPEYCLSVIGTVEGSSFLTAWLAARDDVQFGYPVLPLGIEPPFSVEAELSLSGEKL